MEKYETFSLAECLNWLVIINSVIPKERRKPENSDHTNETPSQLVQNTKVFVRHSFNGKVITNDTISRDLNCNLFTSAHEFTLQLQFKIDKNRKKFRSKGVNRFSNKSSLVMPLEWKCSSSINLPLNATIDFERGTTKKHYTHTHTHHSFGTAHETVFANGQIEMMETKYGKVEKGMSRLPSEKIMNCKWIIYTFEPKLIAW